MKKIIGSFLFLSLLCPVFAQASVITDLVGVVKDLQKQLVDLVTTKIDPAKLATTTPSYEEWTTYTDPVAGYRVQYPDSYGTSTIFAVTATYKNAAAFVRSTRADFLAKIVKPSSTAIDLAVQDSVIFFRPMDAAAVANLEAGKVSTSTKQLASSTVEYILADTKTNPDKFAGGSTEYYVFTRGTSTIVAEANYSADTPSGPLKTVFDEMLTTFAFVDVTAPVETTTSSTTSSELATSTPATDESNAATSTLATTDD